MKKKHNEKSQDKLVKHRDSLESLAMNLGVRQQNMNYVLGSLLTDKRDELFALWFTNWVAHKFVSKRSADTVRKWRTLNSTDLDADSLDKFEKLERKLKVKETVRQALQWASLFGTGGILLASGSPDTPWTDSDRLERIIALDRHSISIDGMREDNIFSPYFGEPEYYTIKGMQKVHRSKIILVNAGERPLSYQRDTLWGVSDLDPIYEELKRYNALMTNVGDLVTESKIDIFKMEDFANQVASGEGPRIQELMNTVQEIKSSTNSLLIDKNSEYDQKELTFSGLKDLLVEFRNAVAGAADMPMTVLFGQSAAGFATGEEDQKNYYDSINSMQETRLRPVLERLDPILCRMSFGDMPDDWWFEFNPLGEMTKEQESTVLLNKTNALSVLVGHGVVREDQVAEELRKDGLLTTVSDEDIDDLKKLSEEVNPNEFTPINGFEQQTPATQPKASTINPEQAN